MQVSGIIDGRKPVHRVCGQRFCRQALHQPHSVVSAFVIGFLFKALFTEFCNCSRKKDCYVYQILVIFVLHLSTGKLICHLKQAQKSILNVSNL